MTVAHGSIALPRVGTLFSEAHGFAGFAGGDVDTRFEPALF